jgi:response regulator NasT
MRVWLVENKSGGAAGALEVRLKQLEQRPGSGLRLLGASGVQPDFAEAMRKLVPDLLDLLVVSEEAWPEEGWTQDVLNLGLGMVVATSPERAERFRSLAEVYSVTLVPSAPEMDVLWLALLAASAGVRRQAYWQNQVAHLQQRLADRIIIEKAKGILVQRLTITEEDAYKRLRVLSRRQRRPIRDIAQSLLDTEFLFTPDANGLWSASDERQKRSESGIPGSQ